MGKSSDTRTTNGSSVEQRVREALTALGDDPSDLLLDDAHIREVLETEMATATERVHALVKDSAEQLAEDVVKEAEQRMMEHRQAAMAKAQSALASVEADLRKELDAAAEVAVQRVTTDLGKQKVRLKEQLVSSIDEEGRGVVAHLRSKPNVGLMGGVPVPEKFSWHWGCHPRGIVVHEDAVFRLYGPGLPAKGRLIGSIDVGEGDHLENKIVWWEVHQNEGILVKTTEDAGIHYIAPGMSAPSFCGDVTGGLRREDFDYCAKSNLFCWADGKEVYYRAGAIEQKNEELTYVTLGETAHWVITPNGNILAEFDDRSVRLFGPKISQEGGRAFCTLPDSFLGWRPFQDTILVRVDHDLILCGPGVPKKGRKHATLPYGAQRWELTPDGSILYWLDDEVRRLQK